MVVGILAAAGAGVAAGAGFAAGACFGAGGGLFFFWAAPASTVVSIITKSTISILVILALDIFVLLAFCWAFLAFLDVLPTVENAESGRIP